MSNCDNSRTRSRMEQTIGVMENQFGFDKVRYKRLSKNTNYLYVSAALVYLAVSKTYLLAPCVKL